jgi:hypothetical protein
MWFQLLALSNKTICLISSMTIDETPTKDHMNDLHIVNWTLVEEKPFQKINLGTSKVP